MFHNTEHEPQVLSSTCYTTKPFQRYEQQARCPEAPFAQTRPALSTAAMSEPIGERS